MSTNNITFYNLVGQTVKVCKDKYRKGQEGKVISVTKGQVMFQKEGGGNPGSVESFKVYDPATGEYSAVIYSRDVAPGRVLVGTPSSAAPNLNMHQAAPQGPSVSSRPQVPSSTNQQPPSVLDSLQVTSNIQQQPQEQQPDPSPALDAPSGLSTDTVDEQEDSAAVVNEMVDWADVIGSGRDSDSDESEGIEKDVPDDDLGPPERTTTVEMTEDEKRLKLAIAKSDHLDSRSTDITANHHNNNGADDEDDAEDSDDSGSVDLHSEASARALNYYGENSESEDSDSDDGLTRYDVDNTANDGPEFERGPDDDDDLASQSVQSDSDDDDDLDAQQPPSNVVWQPAGQLLRFHAPPLQESLSLHATQIVRGLKRPGPLLEHPESKRACTAWASATVNQGPLLADVNMDVVPGIDSDMEVVQEQPDPPIQDEMILDGDEYQAPLPVDGVMEGIEELTITEGQDEMILVDEEVQQAPLTIDGDMEGIEGSAPTPAPVVVRVDPVQTVSLPPQHDAMQLSEMDEGAAPEVEQPPQVTLEVAQLAVPTHANTPPPTLCQDGTLVAPPEFDTSCAARDPSPSEVVAPAAPAAPIAPDQDVAHEPQAASEDVQSGVSPRVGTPPPTLCEDGIRVTSPVFDASCTPDEPSSSEVAAPSPAVEPEQDVVQTPQTAPEVIGTDMSISVDTSLPAPWQDANFVAPSEFDASTAIPAFTEEGMGVKDALNAGGERKTAVCQEVGKDGSALIGTIVLDDDSSSEGESKSDHKADMSLDDPKCPNTAEEKAAFVELTEQFRKWQLFPAPPMRKPIQRKPMQPKPVPPKPDWLLKEEKKAWERSQRQARLRRVRLQAEEKRELAERSWKQAEAGCLSTTASLVNLSKYEAETLSAQNLLQKYTSAGKDAVHAHIVQIFRQKMFLQQLRSVTSLLPLASNLTDIVAFVAEDSTTDLGATMLQFREELLDECHEVLREIDFAEYCPTEIGRVALMVTQFQDAMSAAAAACEDILDAEPRMAALRHQYKMHADLEKKHRNLANHYRECARAPKEGLLERFGRWVRDEQKTTIELHPEVYIQDAENTATYHTAQCVKIRRAAFEALKKAAATRDAYQRAMFKFLEGKDTLRPEVYEPIKDAAFLDVRVVLKSIKRKMDRSLRAFGFNSMQKILLKSTLDEKTVWYFADEIPEDERPWQLPAWSKKSHQWVEKR